MTSEAKKAITALAKSLGPFVYHENKKVQNALNDIYIECRINGYSPKETKDIIEHVVKNSNALSSNK